MDQYRSVNSRRRGRRRPRWGRILFILVALTAIIVLVCLIFGGKGNSKVPKPTDALVTPTDTIPEETIVPTPTPLPRLACSSIAESSLDKFGFRFDIEVDGVEVDSYTRENIIDFSTGENYTALEGVITFRGSNFRTNASYGTADIVEKTITKMWNVPTYSIGRGISGSGVWTGSGWTGQPILVKWPKATKQVMNMYESAKANDDLVEVIYATMDGHVYFLDMKTGEKTRDSLNFNVPFKGAGSLDPRGYPILYLGQGDHYNEAGREARGLIVSLIDGHVMYEFGKYGDSFALRDWTAYDSSALVCAEADTLVYPGENGVLYTMRLNTKYDETAGTLSVTPNKVVKLRYGADRTRNDGYWLGYEGSAAAYGSYVFLTENSGLMHCVDLNTMEVKWVCDIWDDTNASPAFEIGEDGRFYLYVGNTLDNKANENGAGPVALFKIDAATGEKLWTVEREVYTTKAVTGGVMTSAVLGENDLEGMIFVMYASYGNGNKGTMVAFDTKNGNVIWEEDLSAYAWSSPTAVYDKNGKGYIVQCNYSGNVYLLDGLTGAVEFTFNIESNIEASPAVFDNTIVIGTRVQGIWGLRIN